MNGSTETMNGHHLNNGSAHCGAQNASGSNGYCGVGSHPTKKIVVLVAGAAGFIGSHMARRLKHDPAGRFTVVGADVRTNEYMQPDEFCDVFHQVDLRSTSLPAVVSRSMRCGIRCRKRCVVCRAKTAIACAHICMGQSGRTASR